jgi:hypothetical protein
VSSSGSGWLSATVNPTTAPATLTVQPSTGCRCPRSGYGIGHGLPN